MEAQLKPDINTIVKDATSLEHLVQMVVDQFFPQFRPIVDKIVSMIDGIFGGITPPTP